MKKALLFFLVFSQLSIINIFILADDKPKTEYEKLYPQYVDTKEPLAELEKKDIDLWEKMKNKHPLLAEVPSKDRVDYFDIEYGEDTFQTLDIHHKKGEELRPVIFFIHGGGWVGRDKNMVRHLAPTWVELGYTVVSINYRLAPKNPHPAQIDDCAMALKWVIDNIKDYGGNPNEIAITGMSAGGHLTSLLVSGTKWHEKYGIDISKVKCYIPVSGLYDFSLEENYYHPSMEYYIGSLLKDGEISMEDASPVNYVTGKEPPCLILHGSDDWLVPKTNAVVLFEKLIEKKANNVYLYIVPGFWHVNLTTLYGEPEGERVTNVMNKFLQTYLPTEKVNSK